MGTRNTGFVVLGYSLLLLAFAGKGYAFGAGNIPSIAQVEGVNFRHGDIEDMLTTIAFLKGHKWSKMMIKRCYFGNWLRDYSQAVDVGSLKGVSAPTIRILVWVLSFMSFGYATGEFEVTEERLGVYRPEEHIDNPKAYADDEDARRYDPRLRPPVQPVELEIDPRTGMKNYISNDSGGWATSSGYVKFSIERSIHFGRLYTSGGHGSKGNDNDLCEALRCLGQALHCMEDFSAHSNYCELALRELGHRDVFAHTGANTMINIQGKHVYPLVTGTFGAVDFIHSVLGEFTDHFTQSEIDEMDKALYSAEKDKSSGDGQRGVLGSSHDFVGLLRQVPGLGDLATTARDLQSSSVQQDHENRTRADNNATFDAPPNSNNAIPGTDIDPVATVKKIYPILEFRDRVVRGISAVISKIPGLESLVEKISERLTLFVLGLLAPYVRPIIQSASNALKKGSSGVVEASANSQFEPWLDANSTNPTHSMLSKDHFSNILNGCAGRVATTILQYVTPRIVYAWEHPEVSTHEVLTDILHAFHHPALRNENNEIHRNMFVTVRKWLDEYPDRHSVNNLLSSESVRAGRNHKKETNVDFSGYQEVIGGHGKIKDSLWSQIKTRDMDAMDGGDARPLTGHIHPANSGMPSDSPQFGYQQQQQQSQSNPSYYTGYSGGPPAQYGPPGGGQAPHYSPMPNQYASPAPSQGSWSGSPYPGAAPNNNPYQQGPPPPPQQGGFYQGQPQYQPPYGGGGPGYGGY